MSFHFSSKIVTSSKIQGGPNITTDGLILYYDFANTRSYDGQSTTCFDLSTSKVSGSLTNGPIFDSQNGGTINFDGIDDYIEPEQFNITSGTDLSLDMIVKINSSQAPYANIFDYSHGSGGFVLQQYHPLDSTNWYFYTGFTFVFMTLPTDQFFHLSITKSGTTVKHYINGVEIGTTSTINATGKNSRIGDLVGGGRNFNGSISTFRIYNRALSEDEVLQNFKTLKQRYDL